MPRLATLAFLLSPLVPALAAGAPPAATAQDHPAASAHANATAGQAQAARIEACVEATDGFLDALSRGDFKSATGNFDAQLRAALAADKLGTVWQSVVARYGKLESRGTPQNLVYQGYAVVTVPLRFARGRLGARLACAADGTFAGFHLVPIQAEAPQSSK